MTNRTAAGQSSLTTRVAARDQLSRDELLGLVADLHDLIVQQQATVSRQAVALANVQRRQGESPAPAEPATSTVPIGEREPDATNASANPWAASAIAGSDFTIVFDGGAIGNPGRGYGSYQISVGNAVVTTVKRNYEGRITNNQAELMTLIHALRDLQGRLGTTAGESSVAIRGDSQLTVNTVAGRWKARHPRLVPLVEEAKALLKQFASVDIAWHPRMESVAILGH